MSEVKLRSGRGFAENGRRDRGGRLQHHPQQATAYAILDAKRELAEVYKRRKDEVTYRGNL